MSVVEGTFTFEEGWTVDVTLHERDGSKVIEFPEGTFPEGTVVPLSGPQAGKLLARDGRVVGRVGGELHLARDDRAAGPIPPPPDPAPAPRVRRWLLAGAAAVLIVAGVVVLVTRDHRSPQPVGPSAPLAAPGTRGSAVLDATFDISNDEGVHVAGRYTENRPGTCDAYAKSGVGTSFVGPGVAKLKADNGLLVTVQVAATGYAGPGGTQQLQPFGVGNDFLVESADGPVVTPRSELITVAVNPDGSGRVVIRGRDARAPRRPIDTLTLSWTCRNG